MLINSIDDLLIISIILLAGTITSSVVNIILTIYSVALIISNSSTPKSTLFF